MHPMEEKLSAFVKLDYGYGQDNADCFNEIA